MSLLDTILGSKRLPGQKILAEASPPSPPLSPVPVAEVTEVTEPSRTLSRPYLPECQRENLYSNSQPETLDVEERFSQAQAKLFPFLGRKVWTPKGPGTLLQVFAGRVTV